MNYLSENNRPQSNDPDYWNIWTNERDDRIADWAKISAEWQEKNETADESDD
jgi:hypothetical protein